MRGVHDMGGQPAGAVDHTPHRPSTWEIQVDAMDSLMGARGKRHFTTDDHRRTIESLPPEQYHGLRYYEKWVLALKALVVEKGLLGEAEIDARVADVAARMKQD